MSIATFVDVEAALLNSANEPRREIVEALRAVVRFARNEIDAGNDHLMEMLDEAIDAEDQRAAEQPS
jgi:hypothetical protein